MTRISGSKRKELPRFADRPIPERTLIARIYRVDDIDDVSAAEISIEFDGVDENSLRNLESDFAYLDFLKERENVAPFGLLRLEISVEKFIDETGVAPATGLWFSIELTPTQSSLGWPIDHAQLTEEGYTQGSSGYVGGIEFIAEDGEPYPVPLGASVPRRRSRRQVAINGGAFPVKAISRGQARRAVWIDRAPLQALVRDVGQASFVSLQDDFGTCLLHYDAGWPVAFNSHTVPGSSGINIGRAPVLLSHWDWDHLHGYYVFPQLQASPWFTPVQILGPGASRVAAQLDAQDLLVGLGVPPGNTYSIALRSVPSFTRCGTIGVCAGNAGNRNQTGLACTIDLATGSTLLMTGDADYGLAIAALGCTTSFDRLVVTHHGAQFGGVAPLPRQEDAQAVVSYGKGNTYRHPHPDMVRRHPGWCIEHTADHGTISRGSRLII